MAKTQMLKTAKDFAQAIGPHLQHEVYRCDKPHDRLIGKGCRTCGLEHFIAIADFRANGDYEVFDKEMKAFKPDKKK
jgi:hypothetical protein